MFKRYLLTGIMSTKELIKHVDYIADEHMKKDWLGSVKFKVKVGVDGILQEIDICTYIHSGNILSLNRLYVDSFKYPPPAKGLKKCL